MDVVLFQNVGTYKTWIPSDFWTKQMGSDGYFKGDIGKHASDKMTVCISAMNDELIAITKELTEAFRKSHTVDWEELARAGMRRMVKRLIVRRGGTMPKRITPDMIVVNPDIEPEVHRIKGYSNLLIWITFQSRMFWRRI